MATARTMRCASTDSERRAPSSHRWSDSCSSPIPAMAKTMRWDWPSAASGASAASTTSCISVVAGRETAMPPSPSRSRMPTTSIKTVCARWNSTHARWRRTRTARHRSPASSTDSWRNGAMPTDAIATCRMCRRVSSRQAIPHCASSGIQHAWCRRVRRSTRRPSASALASCVRRTVLRSSSHGR